MFEHRSEVQPSDAFSIKGQVEAGAVPFIASITEERATAEHQASVCYWKQLLQRTVVIAWVSQGLHLSRIDSPKQLKEVIISDRAVKVRLRFDISHNLGLENASVVTADWQAKVGCALLFGDYYQDIHWPVTHSIISFGRRAFDAEDWKQDGIASKAVELPWFP